jgi:hypothetical protein
VLPGPPLEQLPGGGAGGGGGGADAGAGASSRLTHTPGDLAKYPDLHSSVVMPYHSPLFGEPMKLEYLQRITAALLPGRIASKGVPI